ncbi:hypothetical protein EFR00_28360 [Rhizobium sophoriradicis]|uniref:hypothetical protein n=1 Tax=Rhizobium sophoriradicis TaxID=1535245 RepID=UPI00098EC7AA|nr:hypothetical protein [Rhizobium sophoriradicis]RSB86874.1 hypothetical protein EFR00_28360 [Rhizobium sophoriradicis]
MYKAGLDDTQTHLLSGFGKGFQALLAFPMDHDQIRLEKWVLNNTSMLRFDKLEDKPGIKKVKLSVLFSLDCITRSLEIESPAPHLAERQFHVLNDTLIIWISCEDSTKVESTINQLIQLSEVGPKLVLRGRSGYGDAMDVNPLGFVDGRRQPRLPDMMKRPGAEREQPPGETQSANIGDFVIGHGFRPQWNYNNFGIDCRRHVMQLQGGSFVVLARFPISPRRFEDNISAEVSRLKSINPVSEEWLAENLMGVSKDGRELATHRYADARENGLSVSHVSKMRSRNGGWERPILRRGFWSEVVGDWHVLNFVCFQVSVVEQFLHVYEKWSNDIDHPDIGAGVDPIVGKGASFWSMLRHKIDGRLRQETPLQAKHQFVQTGERYCFYMPPISRIQSYLSRRA